MFKLLQERIGFVLEVNGFFWSGYLYCKGFLFSCLLLLSISIALAFYVGNLIYIRGH